MSYVDSLLADGEVVVLRTRQHWLALLLRARSAWLLLLLAVVALLLALVVGGDSPSGSALARASQALSLVAFALLALALVMFLLHAWRWASAAYVITNRRVLQVEGILNKRAADSSLEKINDAVLFQNLFGRIFGYGDLDVLTASESAIDRFRLLHDAPGFKRAMLNQKHGLEMELAHHPSPPLRLGTAGRGAAPGGATESGGVAGAGARAAGAGTGVDRSSDRAGGPGSGAGGVGGGGAGGAAGAAGGMPDALIVTQTLARLAELRDRGAISEDEYQAKKAELLQRL